MRPHRSAVILLAEPDSLTCSAIADMLKACGHVAVPVTTTAPATQLLDTLSFDALVVPVDAHHTHVDLSFVKEAKARQPHLKVVGMSTQHFSPTPDVAGLVDGFLHKPFDMQELASQLVALLSV